MATSSETTTPPSHHWKDVIHRVEESNDQKYQKFIDSIEEGKRNLLKTIPSFKDSATSPSLLEWGEEPNLPNPLVVLQSLFTFENSAWSIYFPPTTPPDLWQQPQLSDTLEQYGLSDLYTFSHRVGHISAVLNCLITWCPYTKTMFVAFGGSSTVGDFLVDIDSFPLQELDFADGDTPDHCATIPDKQTCIETPLVHTVHAHEVDSTQKCKWFQGIIRKSRCYDPTINKYSIFSGLYTNPSEQLITDDAALQFALQSTGVMTDEEIENMRVQKSVLQSYNQCRTAIMEKIIDFISTKEPHNIVFTGHSLGGGYATMACVDLRLILYGIGNVFRETVSMASIYEVARLLSLIKRIDLYTFGSIPLGNLPFSKFLNIIIPNNWKFVLGKDFGPNIGGPLLFQRLAMDNEVGLTVQVETDPKKTFLAEIEYALAGSILDHLTPLYAKMLIAGKYSITENTLTDAQTKDELNALFFENLEKYRNPSPPSIGGVRTRKNHQRKQKKRTQYRNHRNHRNHRNNNKQKKKYTTHHRRTKSTTHFTH